MTLPYQHKDITRLNAEEMLLAADKDGSFLIRNSESIAGAYTLCVLYLGKIHQYRIITDKITGNLKIQSGHHNLEQGFPDLSQLMQDTMLRSKENRKIICPLLYPITAVQRPDSDDSDAEEEIEFEFPPERKLSSPSLSAQSSTSSPNLLLQTNDLYMPLNETTEHDEYDAIFPVEESIGDTISRHFKNKLASIDLSSVDGAFIDSLNDYADNGVRFDADMVQNGKEPLQVQKVLNKQATAIKREIEDFTRKLDLLKQLFGDESPENVVDNAGVEIQVLQRWLDKAKVDIAIFLDQAPVKLRTLNTQYRSTSTHKPLSPTYSGHGIPFHLRTTDKRSSMKPVDFEVKSVYRQKYTLTVDAKGGKLMMVKHSKEVLDHSNMIHQDKILQLIKSTSSNTKLDILIEPKRKETFIFEDARQREYFCQMTQQMKKMHSTGADADEISIFVGTWNMGDSSPNTSLLDWLRCQGLGKAQDPNLINMITYDMYVIGTQESDMSEKEWINLLKTTIQNILPVELYTVASCTLWQIRLVILAKTEHKNYISHVQQSTVRTGIANQLGNKGAVGISLCFSGTLLCFVNCHLTSGHEKNNRRNRNVSDILKGMGLGSKQLSMYDLNLRFHHIFWLGDLNYRLNGTDVQPILEKIRGVKFDELLEKDQLRISREKEEVFLGYNEVPITFPPTYRYARGSTNEYNWRKIKKTGERINVPSWCDRVLWRSYPHSFIENSAYGCVASVSNSDHKPVFAAFSIGIVNQYTTKALTPCLSVKKITIKFQSVQAVVKTSTRPQFILEFQSTCLEGPICSQANTDYAPDSNTTCSPIWKKGSCLIPQMTAIIDDPEHLEEQYILISLKTTDGMESYGEAVLSLKCMYDVNPQNFLMKLQHQGEITGEIKGLMHFTTPDLEKVKSNVSRKKKKSYEFVYMDTDKHASTNCGTLSKESAAMTKPETASPVDFLCKRTSAIMNLSPTTYGDDVPPYFSLPEGFNLLTSNDGRLPSDDMQCRYDVPKRLSSDTKYATVGSTSIPSPVNPGENDNVPPSLPKRLVKLQSSSPANNDEFSRQYAQVVSKYTNQASPPPKEKISNTGSHPVVPPRRNATTTRCKSSEDPIPDSLTASRNKRQKTISEWLLDLGMPQYISKFMASGWDQLQFIGDLTIADLFDMGIIDSKHVATILKNTK